MVEATEAAVSSTMYATKRRRRSVKTVKAPMKDPPKSNPSKRHRLRLNAELDHLASLLPFEQSVISRLDRLSILRLGVCYLRTKSHFQTASTQRYSIEGHHHLASQHHIYSEPSFTDTDSVLQALNGFLFVVSDDGEVFFSSRTVEQYLGFHQSDIIHQSALELIHSEDRENFKAQLNWRSQLPSDRADITLQEALNAENCHYLNRTFTVRFRCLLDNTSGFITLEISGHMKIIHGQNLKSSDTTEPVLALFAICCPFGPLPMLDVPPRDYTFKSKHKMDLAPLSMDHRGKLLFGFSDHELQEKGGYDLIHPEDLSYYAAAHQELIKTGSSGLIAYRLITKDFRWMWLQTSTKVIYKNSKPDFVVCTHRHLTDDEGRDLVGKRGTEFKLPYPIIDTDLSGLSSPVEDDMKLKSPRGKKSKTQLRDYLQTGRKRKTPYRDSYNGLNGYSPYTAFNGYTPANGATDIKPDLLYPYGSNTYGLESDLYRTGYGSFPGSMYPSTDSFRLEADKAAAYSNGYYFDSRQYQHSLPYPSNGYSDYIGGAGSKYGYDISKYGYDMSGYGLDLTKRGVYEDDITKYENDLRKYDYAAADKLSRSNGVVDPLKSGGLYGSTPLLNNDSLLSCNMPHATASPCSIYRSDATMDRTYGTPDVRTGYTSGHTPDDNRLSYDVKTGMKMPTVIDTSSTSAAADRLSMPNGHTSVIRNPSPRTTKTSSVNGTHSSMYSTDNQSRDALVNCDSGNAWSSCNKQSNSTPSTGACKSNPSPLSHHSSDHSASQSSQTLPHGDLVSPHGIKPDPMPAAAMSSMTSHSSAGHGNSSPASATTATSVIQQSGRNRSCDKQYSPSTQLTSPLSAGGIAVPVVKSAGTAASSWLPSAPNPYDWHLSSTPGINPESAYSACHQRVPYYHSNESTHISRGVIESPKSVIMKHGEPIANPLLSFSEMTHTLLNGAE